MGYTHYWTRFRPFTDQEWKLLLGETKRLVAKARRGYCHVGQEDLGGPLGCGPGFRSEMVWRTFEHPEQPLPQAGAPILLAGPSGRGQPRLNRHLIAFNGQAPHDYESFILPKMPPDLHADRPEGSVASSFCKTELRPYDAVVVSVLAVARTVAPEAISVRSDGGEEAIRYLF